MDKRNEAIKAMREAAGITQTELAAKLNENPNWISKRESGAVLCRESDLRAVRDAIGEIRQERDQRYAQVTSQTGV